MKVVKHLMGQVSKGVEVIYITGNHDEMLRRFKGFRMGSFSIKNKVLLQLSGGEKSWIFHGDVFDVTMQHSRWLCRLGAIGYDSLILLNRIINWFSEHLLHKGKISLSKKIKGSVKEAISYINDFEHTAASIGIENRYDYVVCGHIHQPQIRRVCTPKGSIMYLNSGDWIENLTALEYAGGQWSLYYYHPEHFAEDAATTEEDEPNASELFANLLSEFNIFRSA
jgi:UDP-2,3-diacylglucosamine pyrophosphatase LpxH